MKEKNYNTAKIVGRAVGLALILFMLSGCYILGLVDHNNKITEKYLTRTDLLALIQDMSNKVDFIKSGDGVIMDPKGGTDLQNPWNRNTMTPEEVLAHLDSFGFSDGLFIFQQIEDKNGKILGYCVGPNGMMTSIYKKPNGGYSITMGNVRGGEEAPAGYEGPAPEAPGPENYD